MQKREEAEKALINARHPVHQQVETFDGQKKRGIAEIKGFETRMMTGSVLEIPVVAQLACFIAEGRVEAINGGIGNRERPCEGDISMRCITNVRMNWVTCPVPSTPGR
ncbi:MAG: hypothetical protein HQL56_17015 [Magnetococcales bacterium]|nr:hypothetical protein [Magnetococcales bacterium]